MIHSRLGVWVVVGLFLSSAGFSPPAWAGSGEDKFYQAFFLETERGDCAAAVKLYEEVVGSGADKEIKAQAKARLEGCREELASGDLAKLMPPGALAYVEINRPGDQLIKLVKKLGLLADGAEQAAKEGGKRLAISPALIKEVLGIRGAAVALTGFNPMKGAPTGVLVFHPGNLEVLRGIVETGLPVGGKAAEPIGGFATYDVEGQALITLTSRLVIVSNNRNEIEGVIARLSGKDTNSLAKDRAVAEDLKNRDDSLFLFFVNAKPIIPMLKGMMMAGGKGLQELSLVDAIVDPGAIHSVSGRVGVTDDGIALNLGLRLDEGHHNLVFNSLRTPAINPETLKSVPQGAAVVVVGALNEAESRYSAGTSGKSKTPVVTALDLGREFFANITSFALYALPPDGSKSEGGLPIPDAGVIFTVNDPAKSEAIWSTILGVATIATGKSPTGGETTDIEGVSVKSYQLPPGVNINVATVGNDLLVSVGKRAISSAIQAKKTGKSITKDETLAPAVARIGPDSTKAMIVHAGRCAQLATRFMSPGDAAETGPFMGLLDKTVASLVVDHSGERFGLSLLVSGIPNVSPLVTQALMQEEKAKEQRAEVSQAMKGKDWAKAISAIDGQLEKNPGDADLLRSKFKVLAAGKKDREAAIACGERLFEQTKDNAKALNNFAWALLTEGQYGDAYPELALKCSQRSNELSDFKVWAYLDTLAWAKFKTGAIEEAVALEKKAMDRCEDKDQHDLKTSLARFEAALEDSKLAAKSKD